MRPIADMKKHLENMSCPEPNTGCWLWCGGTRNKRVGLYGGITVRRRSLYAHRVSYEVFVGPIPEGLDVLHRCDQPACINPEHLTAGTHRENMQDCLRKGRNPLMLPKTHCVRGHLLTAESTRIKIKNGRSYRQCKACDRLYRRSER